MKMLIPLTAVLGLTVASAQAQMGGGRRHPDESGPWSGARQNEPPKKPKL
ncbi:hypothetical protein [Bradyrhizobium guangzhouense]|nr:hypothetical protein [Bradyrhizobium guangzhouense]